jgi:hypothetical protein
MNMNRRWVLMSSVALVLLGGGVLLIPRVESKTPEAAITESLQSAEEAARKGSVEGVMNYVSDDFKAGPLDKARLRLMLMRAQKNGRGVNYDVKVNVPRFLPIDASRPDHRTVVSKFAAFDIGSGETYWGTDPLMVVMRKEERRKWVFFKEPVWRVVACPALPPLPGEE